MKARVWFVPALLLVLSVASQAGDAKKDSAKLQGKWSRTFDMDGKKLTIDLTFEGDKFTIVFPGDTGKGTVKLDPSKNPKHIDLTVSESGKKEFVGKTSLGIYAVEGDTLKWCANEPGKDARPKEFPASEGDAKKEGKYLYIIFKKAK